MSKTKLIVQAAIKNKESYLLLKRSPYKKSEPEKWEFVSGKVHEMEYVEEAAIREITEETSLQVSILDRHVFQTSDNGIDYVVIAYECNLLSGEPKISEEHTEYRWVTLEEMEKMRESLASGTKYMSKLLR